MARSKRQKHDPRHAASLTKEIVRARAIIDRSTRLTLKELLRLQRIIVRPGWTTPAELQLVRGALSTAATQAIGVAEHVSRLIRAADRVGELSGVVIVDG